ncbi:hypothetical protein LTR78_008922 [Recurvomyces mirabilis]|uniref:SCP domain-containing protein n=1 Tax=Recurvomyces mirabilis TaxID=574656 RepID=A0AAE0WFI6_9PEZI|nr:hypothetical protein LTR78_008922 [Recurvomyces mirabilis]
MASLLRKVKAKVEEARQGSTSNDLSQEEEANLVQKLAQEHPTEDTAPVPVVAPSQPQETPIRDQFLHSTQQGDVESSKQGPSAIPSEKQEEILGDSQPFRPGLVPNQGQKQPDGGTEPEDKPLPETPSQQVSSEGTSQPEQHSSFVPDEMANGDVASTDHQQAGTQDGDSTPAFAAESTEPDGAQVEPAAEHNAAKQGEEDKTEQKNCSDPMKDGEDGSQAGKENQEPRKEAYSSPEEANAAVTTGDGADKDSNEEPEHETSTSGNVSTEKPADNGEEESTAIQPGDQPDGEKHDTSKSSAEPSQKEEDTPHDSTESNNSTEPKPTEEAANQPAAAEEGEEKSSNDEMQSDFTEGALDEKPTAGVAGESSAADVKNKTQDQVGDDEGQGDDQQASKEQGNGPGEQSESAPTQQSAEEEAGGDANAHEGVDDMPASGDGETGKFMQNEDDSEKPTEARNADKPGENKGGPEVFAEGASEAKEPDEEAGTSSGPVKSSGSGKDDGQQERADQLEDEQDENLDGSQAIRPGVEDGGIAGPDNGDDSDFTTEREGKDGDDHPQVGGEKNDDGDDVRDDGQDGDEREDTGDESKVEAEEKGNDGEPQAGDEKDDVADEPQREEQDHDVDNNAGDAPQVEDKTDAVPQSETNKQDGGEKAHSKEQNRNGDETRAEDDDAGKTTREPESSTVQTNAGSSDQGRVSQDPIGDAKEASMDDHEPAQEEEDNQEQVSTASKPAQADAEGDEDGQSTYHDSEEQQHLQDNEEPKLEDGNDDDSKQIQDDDEPRDEAGNDDDGKPQKPSTAGPETAPNGGGDDQKTLSEGEHASGDQATGEIAGDGSAGDQTTDESTEAPDREEEKPDDGQQAESAEKACKPAQNGGEAHEDGDNNTGEAVAGSAAGAAAVAGGAYEVSRSTDDDQKDDEQKPNDAETKSAEEGPGQGEQKVGDDKTEELEGKSSEAVKEDADDVEQGKKQNQESEVEQNGTSESKEPASSNEVSGSDEDTALSAHNKAREGKCEDLQWDDDLAEQASKHAQNMAQSRKLHHSGDAEQGENIYVNVDNASYDDAIQAWLKEEDEYDGRRFGEGNALRYKHFSKHA